MKIFSQTLLLFVCVSVWSACQPEVPRHNVVFILVDDLGWTDLGYTGSTFYETPHIDSLSSASIQFTNAYASGSVCSPSRASILTGKHPARLKITDWIPGQRPHNQRLLCPPILNELPLAETTLAEVFRQHQYRTFFAGKWHLGDEGYFPEDQGFDINKGGHHKGSPPGGYYSPYKNPTLTDGPEGEYLTDRLTNEALHFLDTIGKQPFFLYLPYYTVHTPIQPNRQYIEKFQQKRENLEEKDTPSRIEGRGVTRLEQSDAAYASMLYALDKNVGQLISMLKEKGLYEHTTLIFTSDNGGLSTLASSRKRLAPTSVLPLRAGKGWLYEGGIRVPLLIKPAGYGGAARVSHAPVIGHDFFPTLLSLANIPLDPSIEIDGVDLSPILLEEESLGRDELFWHYPHYHGSAWTPGAALRKGDWKVVEWYETNTAELYNLAEDLSETTDLSEQYPAKTAELLERLHELQQAMNASSVKVNAEYVE